MLVSWPCFNGHPETGQRCEIQLLTWISANINPPWPLPLLSQTGHNNLPQAEKKIVRGICANMHTPIWVCVIIPQHVKIISCWHYKRRKSAHCTRELRVQTVSGHRFLLILRDGAVSFIRLRLRRCSHPLPPTLFMSPLANKQRSLLHAWWTRNCSPLSVRQIAGRDGCVSQSVPSHLRQVLCVLQVI